MEVVLWSIFGAIALDVLITTAVYIRREFF